MAKDTRKRIALTVSPEVHAALSKLTDATGVAAASYVASLLQDALPVIEATVRAVEVAKRAPREAAAMMDSELGKAIVMAGQASLDLHDATRPRRKVRRTTKP